MSVSPSEGRTGRAACPAPRPVRSTQCFGRRPRRRNAGRRSENRGGSQGSTMRSASDRPAIEGAASCCTLWSLCRRPVGRWRLWAATARAILQTACCPGNGATTYERHRALDHRAGWTTSSALVAEFATGSAGRSHDLGVRSQPSALALVRAGSLIVGGVMVVARQFWTALLMLGGGLLLVAWDLYGGSLGGAARDLRQRRTVGRRRRNREARITARRGRGRSA
jgi:hypothetical protein